MNYTLKIQLAGQKFCDLLTNNIENAGGLYCGSQTRG